MVPQSSSYVNTFEFILRESSPNYTIYFILKIRRWISTPFPGIDGVSAHPLVYPFAITPYSIFSAIHPRLIIYFKSRTTRQIYGGDRAILCNTYVNLWATFSRQ